MVQHCPRCQRANPPQAVFCHFDGCLLRQASGGGAVGILLQEFVFPSGRRCRTFDEIVQGCYYEWEDARQLLGDGTFSSFLAGVGRADLARAAREASGQTDRDIGLTNFIAAMPATAVQGPKLGLSPRKLVIGPVRVGEMRTAAVNLLNEGRGLLQGKVTVADAPEWLTLAEGDTPHTLSIKTGREAPVSLRVDTSKLAVSQNYSTKLVIVTNGGVAEVPIRLDLVVRPFARAPFAGANSQRDLARRMVKEPDAAMQVLSSGEVARWFASNGWAYPIAGTPAPGKAAVQQFFEELGMAKPPPIALSDQEYRFRCTAPAVEVGQLTLRTNQQRIVFGRAESDVPWLKVKTPSVGAMVKATIDFEVDSSLMDEDKQYLGHLKVIANGGQAFTVRVQVDVQGNKRGWFARRPAVPPVPPPPVEAPVLVPVTMNQAPAPAWLAPETQKIQSAAVPAPPTMKMAPPATPTLRVPPSEAIPAAGIGRTVVIGALLGVVTRLLLAFPADLWARVLGATAREPVPGSLTAWLMMPAADENYLRLFVLATWWLGALVGVLLVWRGGGRITDLFCGLLAGSMLGLAGAATMGCIVVLGDTLPRMLLNGVLGSQTLGPVIATPLWIALASVCWLLQGAVVGLVLGILGRGGESVLAAVASPLAALCRAIGMGWAAEYLALRGP